MIFNRSQVGCVANSTVGRRGNTGGATIRTIYNEISGNMVRVFSFCIGGTAQDTSFMVTVVC